MVNKKKTEELFEEWLGEEKINIFPNNGFTEMIINSKFGFKIKIYFEYIDELYNIKIIYCSTNEYCITSFDFYKKFVRQKIKNKLFQKKSIFQHLEIFKKYLDRNFEIIKDENKLLQLISGYEKKYQNIFL